MAASEDVKNALLPRGDGIPARPDASRLAAVLLLGVSALFLVKVFTGDYGTHLAIGREIWRTRSLPAFEFLNYPYLGTPNYCPEWAFQLLLHGVYTVSGTVGVSLLCWAVATGTVLFLHRAATLRGAHPVVAALAMFAFAGFLRIRTQPRPEIFTGLFVAVTLWMLSSYYFGKRRKLLWGFPPLVVLWVNFHPSIILGFAVSGFFLVDALAAAAARKELRWSALRGWVVPPVVVLAVGLACTGVNPYGYSAFLAPVGLARSQTLALSITEMAPVASTDLFPIFVGAAAAGVACLALGTWARAFRLVDLLLLGFALKTSHSVARAISLPALLMAPGVAVQATAFLEKAARTWGGAPAPSAKARLLRNAAASLVLCGFLALGVSSFAVSLTGVEYGVGFTEHKYSLKAVEFIRKVRPPGKMFNFFDLGGFLDWQLHPDHLTFIDGRTRVDDIYMDYNLVVAGFPGWDAVLEKYGADWVIIQAVDSAGTLLPIVDRLSEDRRWALVFSDGLALIYLKDTPGNAAIIRDHRISKARVHDEVVAEARHAIHLGMPRHQAYVIMGNTLAMQGNNREAVQAYRKALEYRDDPFLRRAIRVLEPVGERR